MLVLLEGKTLVKGVSSKSVYYFGSIQEDGYIYFNDDRHYRASVPSNETTNPEDVIHPENVQQWYVQTDRWIRSNIFTSLMGVVFDFNDVTQKITNAQNDATTAINDAASAYNLANTANNTADSAFNNDSATLGKLQDNGDVLLDTVNLLNQVVSNMNAFHSTTLQQISATIWTN